MNSISREKFHVERLVTGRTIYLRYGYWVIDRRKAQTFETRDAAEHARALKRQGGRICFEATTGTL